VQRWPSLEDAMCCITASSKIIWWKLLNSCSISMAKLALQFKTQTHQQDQWHTCFSGHHE
jgi:hypothetical protein